MGIFVCFVVFMISVFGSWEKLQEGTVDSSEDINSNWEPQSELNNI